MEQDATQPMSSAERLRLEFDRSFTLAPKEHAGDALDFVLVSAGGRGFALPVKDLCGIEHGLPVVPVPSRVAALVGLAGVRSAVLPVFSLNVLLGVEPLGSASLEKTVFARVENGAGEMLGLAFDALQQFVRVAADAVIPGEQGAHVMCEEELFRVVEVKRLLHGIAEDR